MCAKKNAAAQSPEKKVPKKSSKKTSRQKAERRCGLCGKTGKLTKTECCGNWICDDEANYQLFSYAHNSCSRNHRRYTLCGGHFSEGHAGDWQTCPKCRQCGETEMYVYFGTNEYNFEVLLDPPAYEPTKCSSCGKVIILSNGGYSSGKDGYTCGKCMVKKDPSMARFVN